jgi:phosphoglycolate phosphatase
LTLAHVKAVVFDLDGTLVDSAPDIAAALNGALAQVGHAPLALPDITRMIGGGARLLAKRSLEACGEVGAGEARVTAVYEAFHDAYQRSPAHQTTLFPGAREALIALHGQQIALGLCTNKPAALTGPILDALAITDHFGSMVAAAPGVDLKPAPAMLRTCLQELGVDGQEAVMVGDSAADVGAARAAGVAVILISHGYTSIPAADLGADVVISHFDDLIPALSTHGQTVRLSY